MLVGFLDVFFSECLQRIRIGYSGHDGKGINQRLSDGTFDGYGFPIADGDAVTLDFEKAKEFLKKHVGSFGQTDEEMQILDALEHAESEDAEEGQ